MIIFGVKVTNTDHWKASYAHAAAFSSDGEQLALSRGRNVEVVDTPGGRAVKVITTG